MNIVRVPLFGFRGRRTPFVVVLPPHGCAMRQDLWRPFLALLALIWFAAASPALEFRLRFDEKVSAKPFTGRVYVMLSQGKSERLPVGPKWIGTEPFFAKDVKNWKAETAVSITNDDLSYPTKLDKLPKKTFYARAIMDFDRGERSFVHSQGNAYSRLMKVKVTGDPKQIVKFTLDEIFEPSPLPKHERIRFVELESALLSKFHGRPVMMKAGVILPKSYEKNPNKRYPVVYEIPGFSGTATFALRRVKSNPTNVAGVEMLHVVLDPSCRWGHHVFADSANNGPCGQALIQEFIPHLETTFRAIGEPRARFLRGHSSGGWSSLWLQVTYPDFFGGTWSTAPDSVDFRDFQRVNVYAPGTNIFRDNAGKSRPLVRKSGKVRLNYKQFSDMELVMGHGGQLGSFEGVFSPRGQDGRPLPLYDRTTGAIDLDVARSWEKYDIRLVLERNWKALGPKLRGKIHVFMGLEDNFYLEGATILLKRSLKQLGSDAVVELYPGKDHSTLMSKQLRQKIAREMAAQFRKSASRMK